MAKKKPRRKKSRAIKLTEYYFASVIFLFVRSVPLKIVRGISAILGDLFFFISRRRRTLAIENLTHAFGKEKNNEEIIALARQCCRSIVLTFLESIKFRYVFSAAERYSKLGPRAEAVFEFADKMKKLHDEMGACIFVTPHIGNWEVLPFITSLSGIPLTAIVRSLDNEYLEKLMFANRTAKGQSIIPKQNSYFTLHRRLRKGSSLGIMPDQSTSKGLLIDFFGRKATTTPVPAILSITHKRPIVVVACCRKEGDYNYEGIVSEPILPGQFTDKKEEIRRITEEVTRKMEAIIRRYPGQYLWVHNRWKSYKDKKEFLS